MPESTEDLDEDTQWLTDFAHLEDKPNNTNKVFKYLDEKCGEIEAVEEREKRQKEWAQGVLDKLSESRRRHRMQQSDDEEVQRKLAEEMAEEANVPWRRRRHHAHFQGPP